MAWLWTTTHTLPPLSEDMQMYWSVVLVIQPLLDEIYKTEYVQYKFNAILLYKLYTCMYAVDFLHFLFAFHFDYRFIDN